MVFPLGHRERLLTLCTLMSLLVAHPSTVTVRVRLNLKTLVFPSDFLERRFHVRILLRQFAVLFQQFGDFIFVRHRSFGESLTFVVAFGETFFHL